MVLANSQAVYRLSIQRTIQALTIKLIGNLCTKLQILMEEALIRV